MSTLGSRDTLYNRIASLGGSDPADGYDVAKRLGNVVAGDNIYLDGTPITLIRGVDQSTTDMDLTTSWQLVPNAAVAFDADISDGALHVMGAAYLTGSGSVEFGISDDAGTAPTNQFQQITVPASYDAIAAFGGVNPNPIPLGTTNLYLWAKASSGTVSIRSSTGAPTHWGVGVQTPDAALHNHLSTRGHDIAITDASGVRKGALVNLDDGTGIAIARVGGADYDPDDGGVAMVPGKVELHGSVVNVDAMKGSGVRDVQVTSSGDLFTAALATPGWERSDTSNSATGELATLLQWVQIPGLSIIVPEIVAAGDRVNLFANVYIVESGGQAGSVDISFGINGAAPVTSGVNQLILASTSNLYPVASVSTTHGGLAVNDTMEIWVRRSTQDHNGFAPDADGSTGTLHEEIVSVPSAGGGGGEGEANVLSNKGAGASLDAGKDGVELGIKSITGTGGATVTATATEVNIDVVGAGGDMTKAVYDPGGVNADAFARANHTGTQALATISDSGSMAAVDDAASDGTGYVRKNGAWAAEATELGGDVVGPAGGVVDEELAVYDGTTGKIIKGGNARMGGALSTMGNGIAITRVDGTIVMGVDADEVNPYALFDMSTLAGTDKRLVLNAATGDTLVYAMAINNNFILDLSATATSASVTSFNDLKLATSGGGDLSIQGYTYPAAGSGTIGQILKLTGAAEVTFADESAGGGASAPSVRVIDQATTPADITIANNEIVHLTPNGASINVAFAAAATDEATVGELWIMGGTSAITFTGPVAADWPGGSIPDTTSGRHTVSGARTATNVYTMTHQGHQ